MSGIVIGTDATFGQEVEQSSGLTLVDFWATWCGPCKKIAPLLEEIAVERARVVKVVKVDTDANAGTAVKFGIRSAPTLIVFKDGIEVARILGAVSKAKIEATLDEWSHIPATVTN